MLRLLLDGNEMDLYEDVSVNLTLQFSDVQNVNSPAGSFSQTFRIPATANNLDYFGAIDDTTAVDIVNVKQRIPAEILSDTIPILSGFCQVKAVYLQKERYADIELVFFGGAVDLKSAVGDGFISELDLSALNHEVNRTNIENSWLATSTSPAPYVRYGVIDKGYNWSADNPPWTSSQGIYQNQLTPFVSVYSILDAIITEAGFTWESSFFGDPASTSSTTRYMYTPCNNGNLNPPEDGGSPDNTVRVNLNGDVTTTHPGSATGTLGFDDSFQDAYDPEDNWDNTTFRYTAPENAIYSLSIRVWGTLGDFPSSPAGPHSVGVSIYKNGSLYSDIFSDALLGANLIKQFDETITLTGSDAIELNTGDYLDFRYSLVGNAKLYGNSLRYCSVQVINVSPPVSLFDVDIAGSLPEVKQIDFLTGLQKVFNLVFVPDKNKPSHLMIEPFQDYVATGTQKDWTDKVDYSKDLTFKPTTDLQKKQYEWTYKPGLDFISDTVQKSLDRVYGRYRVTEPDNDFAKGEQKIETNFGQFMVSMIPGVGFPIHRSLQADGQAIEKPLPMVAYWAGLTGRFGDWFLEEDAGTTPTPVQLTEFPLFSNYNTDEPTVEDKDLNYGMEQPFMPIEANPANTLYFEYWAQYVAELYSYEARIMTCTMKLSKQELADFEFSDNIYLKDSYWRVLKINYDSNVEGTAKVELIKILSDVDICEDTPTSYSNRYNVVLFNNSTDISPDYGSAKCCRRYGYEAKTIPVGTGYPGGTSPMTICVPRQQATPPSTT